MDLIITVYGNAGGEVCPIWPGKPSASHWGVQDPASDDESEAEKRQKFKLCFEEIKKHVTSFIKDLEDGSQPKELAFKIEKQFLFLASRV